MKKYAVFFLLTLSFWASAEAAAPKNAFVVPESPGTVNKIVAVVNGERITKFDVERRSLPELMRRGIRPDNPAQREAKEKIFQEVLDEQINEILITQEAARLKMEAPEGEVEKEVLRIVQQSKMKREDFEKQLQKDGMDMKSLRERIRKKILGQRLIASMVGRKIIVNKEDVARYYAENKDSLKTITEVRMAILVYPPGIDPESIAQQIKSGKLSFEEAVRRYSIDPATKSKGGEMRAPWQDMSPDWQKRIGDMKPGEVSSLFNIQQFRAQVKLLEKVGDNKERTLEEATPDIETILRAPLLQERFAEYTQGLRNRAIVDIRGI